MVDRTSLLQVCRAYGVPPWLVSDYEPSRWERLVWWFRIRRADRTRYLESSAYHDPPEED